MDKRTECEIFTRRLVVAVMWNICLQVLFAITLVFIIQVDLLHPVAWFTSTLREIFGFKITLNIVLLVLVSVCQAFVHGRYHLLPPPKYFTRFSLFLNMVTLHNVLFSLLYALSGYFTVCLYSSLAKSDFYNVKKSCQKYSGQCIVEESLFLQFGGMWMGLYYFVREHLVGSSLLLFPHAYQDRQHYLRRAAAEVLARGLQAATAPTLYYCLLYWVWGARARALLAQVHTLHLEDAPLDNILNLISSKIWLSLWLYTGLFFVSVNIMKTVFNTVLTRPMRFPIESEAGLVLHQALGHKGHFNGILGAQDLRMLAISDPQRRQQIFSLSQPGGHPRNWNNILEKCLANIYEFNKQLETITSDPTGPPNNNLVDDDVASFSNIRNLAQSPASCHIMSHNVHNKPDLLGAITIELKQMLHKLCQKPGISYLFGELVSTKLKVLLSAAQPLLWTCEGLSWLAAASLLEDSYGTVQYDLPVIVAALVALKQNLDKISKPGLGPKKQLVYDCTAFKMRSALSSSVKRSIYKITITFSKYMSDIPLEPEVRAAVQSFLLFKEA